MRPRVILYLVAAAALAGCGYTNGSNSEAQGECDRLAFEQQLDALRAEIEAGIGEAEASSVSMCRTLPLGTKPCGGPWTYLVYSAEASDSTRLADLATEYASVDATRNQACDLASDCMIVPPPNVTIQNGRCVAAP